MMLRKIALVSMLLLSTSLLWSQERNPRLKLTASYVLGGSVRHPVTGIPVSSRGLSAPSLSLLLPTSKGNFHEIALDRLSIGYGRSEHTPDIWHAGLGLGYQYNLTTKDRWDKLKLYVGAGISSSIGFIQTPSGSAVRARDFAWTTQLKIVPGLMYDFSDRFFLNLAVPLSPLGLNFTRSVRDPAGRVVSRSLDAVSPLFKGVIPVQVSLGIRF
jgi:hypothetical protein